MITLPSPTRPPKQKPVRDERYNRFKAAAEQVFAERGYDGTTIREIARRAECNLGMLSHYWKTKQALFTEIFRDRFACIFEYQMRGFTAMEERARDGQAPSVREVLSCLIEAIFLSIEGTDEAAALARLMFGRALLDPSPEVEEAMAALFSPASAKLFQLLRAANPAVSDAEFYWRALCVIGAFSFADGFATKLTRFISPFPGGSEGIDWRDVAGYVVNFLVAGMEAPGVPATPGRG